MAEYSIGFAECACGAYTPVQPCGPRASGSNQRWIETGKEFPFIACARCKRLFQPAELAIARTPFGLSPYHAGAAIHVFGVSIPCGEGLDCPPIRAIAVRNTQSRVEDVLRESATWQTRTLKCAQGHVQPFPSNWH
jgi:hypothetical protein